MSGLPTGAFAASWPDKMLHMGLLVEQASILLIANTAMYAVASSLLGRLTRFLKLESIDMIGVTIVLMALLGIALAPNFAVVIMASALAGVGSGLVDSGLNSYLAKYFSSARYLNWLNAFWGLGPTVAPLIMVTMIAISGWRLGYFAIAGIVGVSAVLVLMSLKMRIWTLEANVQNEKNAGTKTEAKNKGRYLTRFRHKAMEVTMFFMYGGMETSMGFWLATVLVESRGVTSTTAGLFTAFFYGATMSGRMIFGILANRFKDITMVRVGVVMAVGGLVVLLQVNSLAGAVLVGFGFAPIFPCLVHNTANRFNPKILSKMIGYEVAAYGLGAAILSSLKGPVLSYFSLELLFPVLLGMTIAVFLINEMLELIGKRVAVSP